MTDQPSVRLSFDASSCDGWGMCSLVFPEGISLDRWGFAHVMDEPVPGPLVRKARRAAACCPRQALTILETDPAPRAASNESR
ncbi:MAG: ferredoxin [Acidobacteriota bacterium]|nr:ferredoxin [Acidobacteriota bacterium]